jgi:excisionase family DNA binding protein
VPSTPAAQMLTLADVRHRLHISDSTARRLIKDGDLPSYKFAGQLRFDPTEVQAYIDRSRVPAAS